MSVHPMDNPVWHSLSSEQQPFAIGTQHALRYPADVAPFVAIAQDSAGFDDETIVEILAHVALNVFTNYVNVALRVPVDFPAVKLRRSA